MTSIGDIITQQLQAAAKQKADNERGRRKTRAEGLFWQNLLERCPSLVATTNSRMQIPMRGDRDK